MTTPINIPKLGVAMTEGTLVSWAVADGNKVESDELLYTLETDKVENDIYAPSSGIVRHIGEEGETYPVGTQIGLIE